MCRLRSIVIGMMSRDCCCSWTVAWAAAHSFVWYILLFLRSFTFCLEMVWCLCAVRIGTFYRILPAILMQWSIVIPAIFMYCAVSLALHLNRVGNSGFIRAERTGAQFYPPVVVCTMQPSLRQLFQITVKWLV